VPAFKPVAERFWTKVAKGEGCWLWTAPPRNDGYGQFNVRGRPVAAHRLSWELNVGPIPVGLHVLHRCDTPACVRPDHLFLGTQADNNADKRQKGRQARGEKLSTKLTERAVRKVRQLLADGAQPALLAGALGVHRTTIVRIGSKDRWGHLDAGG